MSFHQFYSRFLGIAKDGVHKECRAKDPDNCRKCHTGRFAAQGGNAAAGESATKSGGAKAGVAEKRKTELWKIFKKGGNELYAYTVRGEGAKEEEATKGQLADENGCKPEDIDVVSEYRPTTGGAVPGENGNDEKRISDILSELAKGNPHCQIADLEVIDRGNGKFEIKGGMINADDRHDVDNALWEVRHALLERGYKDADWRTSGDFGFFFTCKKGV